MVEPGVHSTPMHSVTVTRTIEADPEAIAEAMADVEPFMAAAGFDEVAVDGDRIEVTNAVGIATIELTLERVDPDALEEPHDDAVFAYEQREGIFEEMVTSYSLSPGPDGTEVEATTTFALAVAVVGDLLDATVIDRQRRRELEAQFDWLADETAATGRSSSSP